MVVSRCPLGSTKVISSFHWPTSLSRTLSSGGLGGGSCARHWEEPTSRPAVRQTNTVVVLMAGLQQKADHRRELGPRHGTRASPERNRFSGPFTAFSPARPLY